MKAGHLELGRLIAPAKVRRAGNKDYPVLSMTMRDGLVNQSDKFKKRIASANTSQYKVVERNQLVVGFPIDEGVLAFQNLYDEAIVSPAYNVWSLQDEALTDSRYLERFLRSSRALAFYKSKLRSTTARRRSLPNDIFLSLSVPVPPLAEQARIVKLLDEADELRKLRAQADRRTAALIPALFHEMFGDPAVNSRRWKLTAISEIAEVQGGLQLTPARNKYSLKSPYLRVANVQRGFLVLDEMKKIGLLASEYERTRLAKGDLLLVEGNGNPKEVGRAAIWDGSIGDCVHQNHLIRVRPRDELLRSEYLLAFVNSESGRNYFHGSGNTTSGLVTISTSIVKSCRIPVPPLLLQKEFAERVAEIREMETTQAANRLHLENLFQSMLHRAFNGDL